MGDVGAERHDLVSGTPRLPGQEGAAAAGNAPTRLSAAAAPQDKQMRDKLDELIVQWGSAYLIRAFADDEGKETWTADRRDYQAGFAARTPDEVLTWIRRDSVRPVAWEDRQ